MFGRVYVADERDRFYSGDLVHKPTYVRSKYWPAPLYESVQDRYSVGVAWYHWWLSNRSKIRPTQHPITPYDFYKAGVVGEEGSSIRGGANLLLKQKLIKGYYWANTTDELANYVINFGPSVVGISWYRGMMQPSRETGIISPTGDYVGEHAVLVDGINLKSGVVRVKNSWGKDWGLEGYGYLDLGEFDSLFTEDTAEGCLVFGYGNRWAVYNKNKRKRRKTKK